jgi:hypothetical protein
MSEACFTPEEVRKMAEVRSDFSLAAAKCLKSYAGTHASFYKENGYSKYFGNRNKAIDTQEKRKKIILLAVRPRLPKMLQDDEIEYIGNDYPTLADLENYLRTEKPKRYKEYLGMVTTVKLDERARDEMQDLPDLADSVNVLRPNLGPKLQNISCVDMARRCLSEGFKQVGMEDTWRKIDREVRARDLDGTYLQKALADLGWKTLYWNPDTSKNAEWDTEEQQHPPEEGKTWNPVWGGHAQRWAMVRDRGYYSVGTKFPIYIDDKQTLVDFGSNTPRSFQAAAFFLGTAHSGYHVFPGFYGRVIEAHSMRALTAKENIEVSEFDPINGLKGGGPRWTNFEHYRSGVIVVPPGAMGDRPFAPAVIDSQGCVDLRPH